MSISIHVSNKAERMKEVEVKCNVCGKRMKAPRVENPPYYCYWCAGEWRGQEKFRE